MAMSSRGIRKSSKSEVHQSTILRFGVSFRWYIRENIFAYGFKGIEIRLIGVSLRRG